MKHLPVSADSNLPIEVSAFMSKRLLSTLILLLILALAAAAQSIPQPREVLGFEVAEDRKLADWGQVTDYFKKLDAASARVELRELGQTTLKRPFLVAFISSEANIKNLGRIQENQRKLADPRLITSNAERQRLISETPAIVAITCSIHSTEVVATQMSMELAYRLASEQSKATREILDNVLLLLVPSVNPDGIDIVNHWYHKTLGTKYEGTSPPELYHHFTGHDNNRDWFMLTQVETQMLSKLFWTEWFPELVYDVHQQGSNGSRMCVPPFFDPHNPNIDPLIVRQTGTIGMRMATRLQAAGFKGIVTNSTYDMWWHGGLRSAPYYHNAIGILTEAASVRLGTPIEIRREQLRSPTRGLPNPLVTATNFPEAWEGGWWRMRDIANMELITTRAALEEAALHREELIGNFVGIAERAIEAGKAQSPYAYVIPAEQHDKPTANQMIDILLKQGVEVHRAKNEFEIDGKKYGAGSYVVMLAQPYRANVKCLFEAQKYPDRRLYPGGPAEPPYDVAGWTLPMQMGVNYVEASKRFDADLQKIGEDDLLEMIAPVNPADKQAVVKGRSKGIYIPSTSNGAYVLVNAMFDVALSLSSIPHNKILNWRLKKETIIDGKTYPLGSFVFNPLTSTVSQQPKNNKKSPQPNPQATLDMNSIAEPIARPRLALYKSWTGSMDEGWTRFVLEQFHFDYKSLFDAEIRGGNLRDKFDVIILPDMSAAQIINGNRKGSLPDEYTGGIGEEGVAALKAFVEAGGVLICFDSSSELAMQKFNLPVKNALAGLASDQFYAPGSIFRAVIDTTHPIAWGMPAEADVYFTASRRGGFGDDAQPDANRNPQATPQEPERPRAPQVRALAFEITDPTKVRVVARYVDGNPLRSGWLLGPQYIAGKNALVDVSLGKGRVVLFGFRPQHRGQTWGTFKLIFNSILLGGMKN
ncbi:MAG: M14 family metallopeptidase [Acidobacteriota bacterium]